MLEHNGDRPLTVRIGRSQSDGHAKECGDRQRQHHADAADGSPQHDAFTGKLDESHPCVGIAIKGAKARGQRRWVEPQSTARPGTPGSSNGHSTPSKSLSSSFSPIVAAKPTNAGSGSA